MHKRILITGSSGLIGRWVVDQLKKEGYRVFGLDKAPSPLPEIFLDCAYYYAPKDSRFLADAVKKVLNLNNQKKQETADRAKKRAEYFSWDKAIEGLISEFEEAI